MLDRKVMTPGALKKVLDRSRKERKRIVFTNGCFDIIHYGHVKYLEDARAEGDLLVVAVNSDRSVKKLKGDKRPVVGEFARMRVIAALESVDYVTGFDEETPLETIRLLMPDVLVKGGDWDTKDIVGSDIVTKNGGKVKAIAFVPGYSTTTLINKISSGGY